DEGGADDTLDDLAVVLLLPEGTPGGHDRLVLIGEQREVEIVILTELRQLVHRVGGDADELDTEIIELGEGVTEIAGLRGAPRGVGLGVEVDHHALTGEIAQGGGGTRIIGEGEGWWGVSNIKASRISHDFNNSGCRHDFGDGRTLRSGVK